MHEHKCPNIECGHIWKHGRDAAGDPHAHECPKCGTEQWYKHYSPEVDEAELAKRLREDPLFVLFNDLLS